MALVDELGAVSAYVKPENFDSFRKLIEPAWIDEALAVSGVATMRKRRLPAEQVVWVVLGMVLFRDRPIEDVVSKLELAIGGKAWTTMSKSAVAKARTKVGPEPMRWLFDRTAEAWAPRSAAENLWRGLQLFGVDGSSIRVADSKENRDHFGGQPSRNGTESGYPLARIVTLMVLRSHLIRAVAITPYATTSELHEAVPLFEHVPDRSLTIVDRGFLWAPLLLAIEDPSLHRHWLTRARKDTNFRVIETCGEGDELVEINLSAGARRDAPSLPEVWTARAIRYQMPGFPARTLLTSLRDPKLYPAAELASLYHERWELELAYDELKTTMLHQEETIRSRTKDGVYQELWGIFLAYNMVRVEMERIAKEARVEPTRISFVAALRFVCDEWEWLIVASPGAIPKRLAKMRANIKRYILPPRRERSFPRVVKRKMSNYDRKRPTSEAK